MLVLINFKRKTVHLEKFSYVFSDLDEGKSICLTDATMTKTKGYVTFSGRKELVELFLNRSDEFVEVSKEKYDEVITKYSSPDKKITPAHVVKFLWVFPFPFGLGNIPEKCYIPQGWQYLDNKGNDFTVQVSTEQYAIIKGKRVE